MFYPLVVIKRKEIKLTRFWRGDIVLGVRENRPNKLILSSQLGNLPQGTLHSSFPAPTGLMGHLQPLLWEITLQVLMRHYNLDHDI